MLSGTDSARGILKLRSIIFRLFRKVVGLFSGSGLRSRFHFVDWVYTKINRGLAVRTAKVHGFVMHIDTDDSMGLSVSGVYEPLETKTVQQVVNQGDCVIDIGANIGYYTLLFAKLVGPMGRVFAFEPDPNSFALLRKNIDVNGADHVSAFPFAVSYDRSTQVLYKDKFGNLDHRLTNPGHEVQEVSVETISLDEVIPGKMDGPVNFIKMDIQGSEGFALEGMKQLLTSNEGILILTEFWPFGLDSCGYGAEKFLHEIHHLGFAMFDVNSGKGLDEPVPVEDLMRKYSSTSNQHTNLLCRRLTC